MGIFKKVLLRCGLGASVGCERISEHSTAVPVHMQNVQRNQ